MESTLPPDPYAALGLPKDATAATIKSTYRKLVLKCHPDKVTDESLKQQKREEFDKIQQAYEIIGDDDKRERYDAEVRLDNLRRDKAARAGVDIKTARYDIRTAAPAGATYTATGPHRYEERKPASRSYDDERYHDERSKRYEYDSQPRHTSSSRTSRPEKEPARTTKPSDRTRSDHKKTRDKEERRNRSNKYSYAGEESSSADEKMRYEKAFRRRSDDARKQEEEEAAQKKYAEARKKAETLRSYDDVKEPRRQRSDEREFDRQRKMEDHVGDAVRYMFTARSKAEPERPSPGRTSSSRDIPRDSYESRSRQERPDPVRRSSARPKHQPESSGRERIQIVDWEDERRAPPSFKHSSSSPAELKVPRAKPERSYTDAPRDYRRTETSPTPLLRRHGTMPTPSSRDDYAHRPSHLRSSESAVPNSGSPPETSYPTVPPPSSTSKKYYYPTPGGILPLHADDVQVANGRRTILREPEHRRTRSPSPLRPPISKPPMGENRPKDGSYTSSVPNAPRIPLTRAATLNVAEMERGRPGRLFNEVTPEYHRRPENQRQASYSPDKVSYAPKLGPENISWARGNGRREYSDDRGYPSRPSHTRHATTSVH